MRRILSNSRLEQAVAGGIRYQSPNCRQIQAARVALGWSQQDLADKAEVGVASVSRLEALPESAEPMNTQSSCANSQEFKSFGPVKNESIRK